MFSTDGGLFYGGGFRLLGVQLLGILAVGAWTAVTMTIVFFIIKKTIGLRVSEEEEIKGLDATEHNLPSAYADFMPALAMAEAGASQMPATVQPKVPVSSVIDAARKALYTGNIGDGKIFLYDIEDVVKVRTGETGVDALQGEADLEND